MLGEIYIERIYRDYYSSLVEYAFSYVGQREIAEDITQEAFVALNGRRLEFHTEASIRSYLYTSVRNLSLDVIKHQKVERRYSDNIRFESPNAEYSFWEAQMDRDIMDVLFKAIDKLPKRCREIFLLHLDGLSNEQIAAELYLSVETVKTQKKKAMKFLRDEFSDTNNLDLYMLITLICMGI